MCSNTAGDLNSRCGDNQDFVVDDDIDFIFDDSGVYEHV